MDRNELAQQTAQHIADNFTPPRPDDLVQVRYVNGDRPPTDVQAIAEALLAGSVWTSWMDGTVVAAMRQLHPAADAA